MNRPTFRSPRKALSEQDFADISSKREQGETWLMLSQEYGMTAEALKRRFDQRRLRETVRRVEKFA